MRNRLNVSWHEKRTTARFPDYLWRLALVATGFQDATLAHKVKLFLDSSRLPSLTASQAVQGYLVNIIELELFSAGFSSDSNHGVKDV